MQSKPESHLYEYAVVRYVPRVERDEFVNVGLIMMSRRRRWLRCRVCHDRTSLLPGPLAPADVARQLDALVAVAHGDNNAGPAAQLPVDERFRWLTAVRSACITTSRPHPGTTADLDATFSRLYSELVL